MLQLIAFLFHTLPLILTWVYLAIAVFSVVVHCRNLILRRKLCIREWIFFIFNITYSLVFFISLIFFYTFWRTFFPVLAILCMIISSVWSTYEDKRNGRRWWTW